MNAAGFQEIMGDGNMDIDMDDASRKAQAALSEAKDRAVGLAQAATQQVETFKNSVQRKVELEEQRPGWQSAAFDF